MVPLGWLIPVCAFQNLPVEHLIMSAVGSSSHAESYPLSVSASVLYLTVPLHSSISFFF